MCEQERRMSETLVAKASTTIDAPSTAVWDALTNPKSIERYFFGAKVTTSWAEDTPIYWKGEWQGKAYEDKGIVLDFNPPKCLEFTHYSPLSGLPDIPTSYHTVTIKLEESDGATQVALQQDNNADERARDHAQKNWEAMLKALKDFVEKHPAAQGVASHQVNGGKKIKSPPFNPPPPH
jgi:uncharacterized protein YndB with AHSA1/START domain